MKRACFDKNTKQNEPTFRARRSQNDIMRVPPLGRGRLSDRFN